MTSATFDPRGFDADPEVLEPERVSILAILGLVFGLICFIPLLPLLGVICAIAGLIAINRSRGRLAGTGMAIAGLILGLLFTALQGAITLGVAQAMSVVSRELVEPSGALAQAIDTGDGAKVRDMLVPSSQPLVGDDVIKTFADAYRPELGAFKSVPQGWELAKAYMNLSAQFQAMQNMQGVRGRNDLLPVPAVFENGAGLYLLSFDQQAAAKAPTGAKFHFKNVTLILPSGKVINMIDPANIPVQTITAPAPGAPGVPPPPETPVENKDQPPAQDKGGGAGGGG